MTLAPASLTIAGAAVDLHKVLADVTIRHGRVDVYDGPTPSALQLTLEPVTRAYSRAFRVGAPLVFTAIDDAPAAGAPLALTGSPTFNPDGSCTIDTVGPDIVRAPASLLTAAQGWFAARVRVGWPSTLSSPTQQILAGWTDTAGNTENYSLLFDATVGGRWLMRRRKASANVDCYFGALAFAAGAVLTVIGKWGAGAIGVSVNGSPFVVAAAPPAAPPDITFQIGGRAGILQINSDVLWFACGTGALTDADAARLHGYGNVDPLAELLPPAGAASMVWSAASAATSVPPAPAPRFTGKITDASLDDDRLTAIAVGRLATLSQYTVGTVDYPAEAWTARVNRVFAEAGLAAYLQLVAPPVDPALAARPLEPVGLDQYLDSLAETIGAAVVDTPDGLILVQPIATRSLAGAFPLDPALVAYVPTWTEVLPIANVVTVKWTGGAVTVQDDASIAFYGPRPQTIDTDLTTAAAADARARERLARAAYSHWNIPSAPYLVGARIGVGQAVTLSGMPASSPYETWTPVLEGWQDSILGDGVELDWTMELALSDPSASGLTLPWNAIPAGFTWATIDQAVQWRDALQLGDLVPA